MDTIKNNDRQTTSTKTQPTENSISKEYAILFNEITKAINQLENLKNELIRAQITAELQFIESEFLDA